MTTCPLCGSEDLARALQQIARVKNPELRAVRVHAVLNPPTELLETAKELRRQAISELRDAGWSHADVAKLLGVSRAQAARIAWGAD